MQKITVTSPWKKLGVTLEQYEALRPWEGQGMSRADFEDGICSLPDAWVKGFQKWILPTAKVDQATGD